MSASTQRSQAQPDPAVSLQTLGPLPEGIGHPQAIAAFGDAVLVATVPAGEDAPGQILRIANGTAESVHEAPGGPVTSLAVFQGKSDKAPCLYASVAGSEGGLLRSEDGLTFKAPGKAPDGPWRGPLAVWGDRLVVATSAVAPDLLPEGEEAGARLEASADPAKGGWTVICDPGFGDAGNAAISALLVEGETLYAATANPVRGFQLWSAGSDGAWALHITDGAGRYSLNPRITAMALAGGELFLGTAYTPPVLEADETAKPVAPELLCLDLDSGEWEILAGQPRFSPDGFKVPFALKGPGFDNPETAAVTAILADGAEVRVIVTSLADEAQAAHSHVWQSTDNGESFEEDTPGEITVAAAAPVPGGLALATGGADGTALMLWQGV